MKAVKLIVVGDPHIQAEPGKRRGVDTAARVGRLVQHINAHHADAVLCLFIGDLTDEGKLAAYERFKGLIAPLVVPPALMMGNHDNRENFQAVFPQSGQDEHGFVQFVFDIGEEYRLIALDSLNAPPYNTFRRHVGSLCPQRLAFLESSLQAAGDRPLLIAMHHHPFRIGLRGMDAIRLQNGPEFLALIARFPNVKMVLMGHNHRSISGVSHGLPFTCFKSISPQTPLDFKSVDPNAEIDEPPSYGVLLLTEEGILVHQEDFLANATPSSSPRIIAFMSEVMYNLLSSSIYLTLSDQIQNLKSKI